MKNVRNSHQSQSSEEPQPYPIPVEIDGDKGGRDGEVVNKGIQLQHEPELVRGGNELKLSTINKRSFMYKEILSKNDNRYWLSLHWGPRPPSEKKSFIHLLFQI